MMRATYKGVKTLEDIKARCVIKENGCWIWQGAACGPGYGQSWFEGRKHMTHRLAYIFSNKTIAPTEEIDHLCNTRLCQNPDHMRSTTHQENLKARDNNKSHCINGHEWKEENWYTTKKGKICKPCSKARTIAFYQLNKEKCKLWSKLAYQKIKEKRLIVVDSQ